MVAEEQGPTAPRSLRLRQLRDVKGSTPANNHVLIWDAAEGKWVPKLIPLASFATDMATQAELDAGLALKADAAATTAALALKVAKAGDSMSGSLDMTGAARITFPASLDSDKIVLYPGAPGYSLGIQGGMLRYGVGPGGAHRFHVNDVEKATVNATGLHSTQDLTAAANLGVSGGASVTGNLTIGGNQSWHAGNDGAASGLDADLLDGRHGAAFSRFASIVYNGNGANARTVASGWDFVPKHWVVTSLNGNMPQWIGWTDGTSYATVCHLGANHINVTAQVTCTLGGFNCGGGAGGTEAYANVNGYWYVGSVFG